MAELTHGLQSGLESAMRRDKAVIMMITSWVFRSVVLGVSTIFVTLIT